MKSWQDVGIDPTLLSPGENKIPCPKCGPTRNHPNDPSLSVNTDDMIWKCHNQPTCDFAGTLKQRDHIQQGRDYAKKEKAFFRPNRAQYEAVNSTTLPTEVVEYFKKRGITHEVLRENKVAFGRARSWARPGANNSWIERTDSTGRPSNAVYFPYEMGGELINVKARLWENGTAQKDFRLTKNGQKILWGIDRAEETTIIVEGEVDLLSLNVAGLWNVVSVPNGASVSEYLEACATQLSKVHRFILAVDGDEAGTTLRDELARRLGKENCLYVTYPEGCKDANEVLQAHGIDGVHALVASAKYWPVEGLVEIDDLADEIDFYYEHGLPTGVSTGFKSVDRLFRIATGSFYIISGRPGMGKSTFIAQILLNVARLMGWQIAIFSPEDSPITSWIIKSLQRLIGKPFEGKNRMTAEEKNDGRAFLNAHFVPIAPTDTTFSIDEILRLARVAVFRQGIKILLIDPWNEIDHVRPRWMDQQDYISQVLSKIRIFARMHDVAVFLVAHPRKGDKVKTKDGELIEQTPDLDDISGSSHFRAKADFGVIIHRNIMSAGKQIVQVICMKVRQPWHGKLGMIELEWDPATGRFIDPEGEVTAIRDVMSSDPELQEMFG